MSYGRMHPAMADEIELELLITIVVSADGDPSARQACRPLLRRVGGRIVASGDCSDEEPGCWSVTIGKPAADAGCPLGPVALSGAVRQFLRELGPDYAGHRVACEFPTAWTVIDDSDLLQALVSGGERLLVEAWAGSSALAGGGVAPAGRPGDPDEPAAPKPEDRTEDGGLRPRLCLVVDVVTERSSGAQWPSRAVASRLSNTVTVLDCTEYPPVVRVRLDLGPVAGNPAEVITTATATLGGTGWSRPCKDGGIVMTRWSAAPTPSSGIAALELSIADSAPPTVHGGNPTASGAAEPAQA
jgi:hypothetical protein